MKHVFVACIFTFFVCLPTKAQTVQQANNKIEQVNNKLRDANRRIEQVRKQATMAESVARSEQIQACRISSQAISRVSTGWLLFGVIGGAASGIILSWWLQGELEEETYIDMESELEPLTISTIDYVAMAGGALLGGYIWGGNSSKKEYLNNAGLLQNPSNTGEYHPLFDEENIRQEIAIWQNKAEKARGKRKRAKRQLAATAWGNALHALEEYTKAIDEIEDMMQEVQRYRNDLANARREQRDAQTRLDQWEKEQTAQREREREERIREREERIRQTQIAKAWNIDLQTTKGRLITNALYYTSVAYDTWAEAGGDCDFRGTTECRRIAQNILNGVASGWNPKRAEDHMWSARGFAERSEAIGEREARINWLDWQAIDPLGDIEGGGLIALLSGMSPWQAASTAWELAATAWEAIAAKE